MQVCMIMVAIFQNQRIEAFASETSPAEFNRLGENSFYKALSPRKQTISLQTCPSRRDSNAGGFGTKRIRNQHLRVCISMSSDMFVANNTDSKSHPDCSSCIPFMSLIPNPKAIDCEIPSFPNVILVFEPMNKGQTSPPRSNWSKQSSWSLD